MPYNIKPYKTGYRLELLSNPEHIFSYHPMTLEQVKKQMRAIETRKHGGGKMSLHAVVIKKPISFDDAYNISKKFIDKNKNFFRETNNSYRFRNIPKTKFEDFKSKIINDYITLIYGTLKGGISEEEIRKQKPSAYRSMQLSKYGYSKNNNKGNLKKWVDEKWLNLNALKDLKIELPCGKKYKGQQEPTVCRPKYKIDNKTPTPLAYNLTDKQIEKAVEIKKQNKRINWKTL